MDVGRGGGVSCFDSRGARRQLHFRQSDHSSSSNSTMCARGTGCGNNQPVGFAKIVSKMTSSSTRGGRRRGLFWPDADAASHFLRPSFHLIRPSFTNFSSLYSPLLSCRLSTSMLPLRKRTTASTSVEMVASLVPCPWVLRLKTCNWLKEQMVNRRL